MVYLRKTDATENVAYETEYSAGFDLKSLISATLLPKQRLVIPTGLYLEGHPTEYGFLHILPRSGLAVKYGIDVLAGVVDTDYRDEIKVVLINHGDHPFEIKEGDRIAQAVFQKIDRLSGVRIKSIIRQGGFGSTGGTEL